MRSRPSLHYAPPAAPAALAALAAPAALAALASLALACAAPRANVPRSHSTAPAASSAAQHDSDRLPVAGAPTFGSADALVTLVAFIDYATPDSALLDAALARLRAAHAADVRVVYRVLPRAGHVEGRLAAEAARAAFAEGRFEPMHRWLLAEHPGGLTRAAVESHAATLGVDLARFRRALDERKYATDLAADAQIAASAGAGDAPWLFVNGTPVAQVPTDAQLAALVRDVRAYAATITPRARAYAVTTRAPLDPPAALAPAAPTPAPAAPPPVRAAGSTPTSGQRYTLPPASPQAPRRGAARPTVVLDHFAGFQCPFSNRVRATLEQVLQRYPNDVQIVWHDYPLPFHQHGMEAAEAAREAYAQQGAAGFWQMHDTLFDHQQALSRADILRYAQAQRLDVGRMRAALDAHAHRAAVQADVALAQAPGMPGSLGTPTTFVNGEAITGAQTFDVFARAIDAARARAPAGAAADPSADAPPDAIRASHILIAYRGAQRASADARRTREQARAVAAVLLTELDRGADFAALARRFSDDAASAARGGDLGRVARGATAPRFEHALHALPVGRRSGVVETELGFHVIVRTE